LIPEHEQRPEKSPALVGSSPRIHEVLQTIEKLGRSQSPVLILGETGTGKEVAARAIHQVCPSGPFVPIDCSALSGPLIESELFGHTKGAFTGAVSNKIGLIELAAGGIAFFDEIGELPLDMQVKLLRVLQEREIRPVGSLVRRKAEFRPVAATNRDLAREVERGRFRQDLYYRINVVKLRLPPLRDRKEDIPELIEHFFMRYRSVRRALSPEVMEAMLSYDWPGNVRELENCVQRIIALCSGSVVGFGDLPSSLQYYRQAEEIERFLGEAEENTGDDPGGMHVPVRRTHRHGIPKLQDVENKAILEALAFTKGDRSRAAALLGIGRTTLYRRLKELNLTEGAGRG
jgi:DNA-binding NtrC family response regulator